MPRARRRAAPGKRPGSEPERLLQAAGHRLGQLTRQLLEATPAAGGLSHEQLRGLGWHVAQLTGGLAEVSTTLALRVEEHARTRLLRTQDGGDPTEQVARATRALAELRQALDRADEAAREYHSCISHLVVDADPTLTVPAETLGWGQSSRPRQRRHKG